MASYSHIFILNIYMNWTGLLGSIDSSTFDHRRPHSTFALSLLHEFDARSGQVGRLTNVCGGVYGHTNWIQLRLMGCQVIQLALGISEG